MELSRKQECSKFWKLEFHYSKLCLSHHDWKAFTYSPWLPYKWHFQAVYLVWRWIIALYFLGWLITSGVKTDMGPRYLVFLTNWSFIAYNIYLLIAALSTTTKYLTVYLIRTAHYKQSNFQRSNWYSLEDPRACCGFRDNKITWYQMLHWLSFTVAIEMAPVVLILYWSLLYRGGHVSGVNANTHLVNGIIAIIDFWLSGLPVNFYHFIYLVTFGATYVVFSGIYFAVTGDIVYKKYLDYGGYPNVSSGVVVGAAFGLILVHVTAFLLYYVKVWIAYHCYSGCGRRQGDEDPQNDEMSPIIVVADPKPV